MSETTDERIRRLHTPGIVDLHFDLPMDLYEKRDSPGLLVAHYLPEFEAGDIGVIGAAIYIEDRYLPEMALRVALDQIARLYAGSRKDRAVRHLQRTRKSCALVPQRKLPCSLPWKASSL